MLNLSLFENFNVNKRILMHCAGAIAATCLVSWFQIKPYGVLFLILFVFWIYKTKCAASIKILPPQELSVKFENYCDKLLQLRKERPSIFCLILTTMLITLAVIGHLLSGSNIVIFGLILSALVSTKYNFKILKVPNKEKVKWIDLIDNDVDEFIPEVNDTDLLVLQRASEEAVICGKLLENCSTEDEDNSDEVPSELLIPDSIPEIDENFESSSEDELIPKIPYVNCENNLELLKNCNVEESNVLEFKKKYFKKDSSISTSSSDDESMSKGLNFQDYTVADGTNQIVQTKNQSILSLVTNLGTSLHKKNDNEIIVKNKLLVETSDESDFEILNSDDLNNP